MAFAGVLWEPFATFGVDSYPLERPGLGVSPNPLSLPSNWSRFRGDILRGVDGVAADDLDGVLPGVRFIDFVGDLLDGVLRKYSCDASDCGLAGDDSMADREWSPIVADFRGDRRNGN